MRTYRRRALTCQELVELVTDYLEGALSPKDHHRFEAHLSECDHCTEYLQQIRATIALTGTLTVGDLSPVQQTELMALFRRWCSESELTPGGASDQSARLTKGEKIQRHWKYRPLPRSTRS
jgi:anti-sigma factor RsiW